MKNLLKLSFYLSLVFMIGLASCGDDDDDDDVDCDAIAEEIEMETESVIEMLFATSSDPDCEAIIAALDDLIDLVEDSRPCLTQAQQDELDTELEEYDSLRDGLECPG